MIKPMSIEVVFTAESTATGGGRDGHVKSSTGRIDLDTRPPKEMGGNGEGTNPEELFSAGYAACFLGALRLVARNEKIDLDDASGITAQVGFGKDPEGGFGHQRQSDRLPARPRAERRRRTDGEGTRGLPVLQGHPRQHRRQAVGEGLVGCGPPPLPASVSPSVLRSLPRRTARPSDPGVVNYAVLGKGSVGNIVGATMRFESTFTDPFQSFYVDNPACNNWADIGLPEVYADPDLASFNGASAQESPTDMTHFVKQAVGVFATTEAADRAFHRVVDRTVGCSGQTTADAPGQREHAGVVVHRRSGNGRPTPTGSSRKRAPTGAASPRHVCGRTFCCRRKSVSPATAGPAVNVLAGAMQNTLGQ